MASLAKTIKQSIDTAGITQAEEERRHDETRSVCLLTATVET